MSYQDWKTLFFQASSYTDDFSMKSVLLHQSVIGDAKRLIAALPLNETGFTSAISLLDHNYANFRKTLQLAVKKLLEYKPPAIDTKRQPASKTLRSTWSTVQCQIRAIENCLKAMSDQGDQVSPDEILQILVLFKMPYMLVKEFEHDRKDVIITSLSETFDLLSKIISRVEITEVNSRDSCGNGSGRESGGGANDNQASGGGGLRGGGGGREAPPCKFCSSRNHVTTRCFDSKVDIRTKWDIVKQQNLCRNCLMGGHKFYQCPSTNRCRSCDTLHHTQLCEPRPPPPRAPPGPTAGRGRGGGGPSQDARRVCFGQLNLNAQSFRQRSNTNVSIDGGGNAEGGEDGF